MVHRLCLAVAQKHPRILRSFWLHMDNASPHTARLTKLYMQRAGIRQLIHPLYSPDLAPSDYWFFHTLKLPMRGRRFLNLDDLEEAVDDQIGQIPAYKYRHCIMESWPKRWRRCVDVDGEYFEGLH